MNKSISLLSLLLLSLFYFSCEEEPNPILCAEGDDVANRYRQAVFTQIDSLPNIQYGTAPDGEQLSLDIFQPKDDSTNCPRPLVLFVHGGGFHEGTRKDFGPRVICENLAFRGYVTASISYRLLEEQLYTIEDLAERELDFENPHLDARPITNAMHDARAAVRFFRKNAELYNIDPNRIAIGGASAGGMTSILVGYMDDEAELFNGAEPATVEGSSGNAGFSSSVKVVYSLCSGFLNLNLIDGPTDPPIFYQQNALDTLFVGDRLTEFQTFADEKGLTYEALPQGGIHCLWGIPVLGVIDLVQLQNELTDFLYEHLVK